MVWESTIPYLGPHASSKGYPPTHGCEDLLMGKYRWKEDDETREKVVSKLKGWGLILLIFPGVLTAPRPEVQEVCILCPHLLSENKTKP